MHAWKDKTLFAAISALALLIGACGKQQPSSQQPDDSSAAPQSSREEPESEVAKDKTAPSELRDKRPVVPVKSTPEDTQLQAAQPTAESMIPKKDESQPTVMREQTLSTLPAAATENCKITSAKAVSLGAKAIGCGEGTTKVLVMEVTVESHSDKPSTLRWKQSIPILKTAGKDVKASQLLIPNWLPMAGGVGPFATEIGLGGKDVGGWLKVDKNTWGGWLAVDKPGSTTGDHISVPVDSITVIVKKEKPVVLKLLFAASPSLENAALTIPGCSPSSFLLAGPSEPRAEARDARTQALPSEDELQKVIADACLADRPSLRGYTGIVIVKETKPDQSEPGKFIVHADVAFVYFSTRMSLGYIDHFVLSKNAEDEWNVEIVKKEQK